MSKMTDDSCQSGTSMIINSNPHYLPFSIHSIADEWMIAPKTLPIKHVEIKSLQLAERIELQKYLRHVYKVNQRKLQMDKDFNSSSCSFSSSSASSSSGSSSSNSSSSLSCDSNSVSSASSMTDIKYASCNSSSYSRNTTTSSHHVIYSAVHTIKRMTKKYRKPPRTMPS